MARITVAEANAWLESTKLSLPNIETSLESQIGSQVLARLASTYDTSSWTDTNSTPVLVRSIIAMYYAAMIYDRAYTDDNDTTNNWAQILRNLADQNIAGLLSGAITLVEQPDDNSDVSTPVFFPNDLSSSQCPTEENPSDGPAAFMMGTVF